MNKLPIISIMGPTGSGKSSFAMEVAGNIPMEIVSTDSMQIYKGMNIGTAKPSLEDRQKVPHYMINMLDIHERIDIYFYVEKAKQAISEILSKSKVPVLVGGSGMYIKSILYGLDPLPSDPELRKDLLKEYEENSFALEEKVKEIDPLAFEKFKENPRKLLRALEVFYLTGKSITLQQSEWEKKKLKYNVLSYNIKLDRKILFDRIAKRTDLMLKTGWVDETSKLINKGLLETPTAWQAIGYSIIAKYLKNEISYTEMEVMIVSATKKYARRQETWFKHQHPEAKNIENMISAKEELIKDFESEKNRLNN